VRGFAARYRLSVLGCRLGITDNRQLTTRRDSAATKKCPFLGRRNGLSALECAVWVAAILQVSDAHNLIPSCCCGKCDFGKLVR
jgi:hypothetical protein